MKFHFDKKYIHWGLTAFFVVVASILFTFAVFNYPIFWEGYSSILRIISPVINGFLIAYLMIPVMNRLELRILPFIMEKLNIKTGEKGKRRMRILSIALTLIMVLLLITGFFSLVVPQLVSSIQTIASSFPQYINNLQKMGNDIFKSYPNLEQSINDNMDLIEEQLAELQHRLLPYMNRAISYVSSSIMKSLSFLWNIVLGLIISIYIMSIKEKFIAQARKCIYALTHSKSAAMDILNELHFINKTFGSYIVSSIVDSLIIGGICFVACLFLQIPFPVLVGVVVGVTNIIPFFGPFMGAIPCALIILMIEPIKSVYFLIMILILQQCDGNIIKPKLFGDSTGLPGFWVIVSIMIGGGLFGIPGMYLGVPVCAILYHEARKRINKRLMLKGLPTDTDKYAKKSELLFKANEKNTGDAE
ncbi:MAG: AI-2E family transporter [Lachnospiraceae bacterium]|nr:AI-2E family transporter [Lachnospiraceae bacterium]